MSNQVVTLKHGCQALVVGAKGIEVRGNATSTGQQQITVADDERLFVINAASPMAIIQLDSRYDVRFSAQFSMPMPEEGQMEIVGREFLAIAERLRNARLAAQIKIDTAMPQGKQ